MANYSSSNFLKEPVSGDTLMYVYNISLVLSMVIDPYSSTFEKSGSVIYIITDGKISYTNSLDFASSGEADLALARLNEVKRIILSWLGTTLSNYYPLTGGLVNGYVSATTFYGDGSNLILRDVDPNFSGNTYKIQVSGGTLNIKLQ